MPTNEAGGIYTRTCLVAVVYAPDDDSAFQVLDVVSCEVISSGSPDTVVEFGPDADIRSSRDYLHAGPIGSENRHISVYRTRGGDHRVICGCWNSQEELKGGTIDEFAERVEQVYGDDDPENFQNQVYYEQYKAFIAMARSRILEWKHFS